MIRRRICSLRKLVSLSLMISLTLFYLKLQSSFKDKASTDSDQLPLRVFASSSAEQYEVNHWNNSMLQDQTSSEAEAAAAAKQQRMKELKLMGLEVISEPLDLRLQVHPSMTEKDSEDVFHRYVAELHVDCRFHVRLGNITDGGWDMCIAGPYLPSNGSCLVYSFGIGDNWSFDDDVSARFGCTVRSFDPSIKVTDHQRSPRVSFYQIGLGSNNSLSTTGWKMMTFSSILSKCHDENKTIDYLKIDIESYEWDALEEIIHNNRNILSRVKQLAIEIHTKELDKIQSTKKDLYRYWNVLHDLELAGFRRWYWHFNIWGFFPSRSLEKYLSCCYETVYININYLNGTEKAKSN